MKRKRRQDPRQTTFAFRPSGRGGARPGTGRRRVRKSRVPHRAREDIARDSPLLVTLRVLDGVPALRGGGGADVAAGDGLAADRACGSGGGAGELAAAAGESGLAPVW